MMLDTASPSVEETMADVAALAVSKRRRRRIIAAGLALFLMLVVVASRVRERGEQITYQTLPVRFGHLTITVSATGNLSATNEVAVGSELSGMIQRMTVDDNDSVTVGQPLAYLNDAKYAAAVKRSRAEVSSAKANYQEAITTQRVREKKLARYRKTRELTNGKLPSTEDLEQAEADLQRANAAATSAEAAIEIADASLSSNEADLKKTVIYSPINGVVLSREVEPGQTVAASMQAPVLYTLAQDLRHMELHVDVDEADVGLVRAGQAAVFTVDAYPEQPFAAKITRVRYGAVTTDGVVTYKATLKVENPNLLLRPGMTATAAITVKNVKHALLVPNAALRFAPDRKSEEKNKGRRRRLFERLIPRPTRRQVSRQPSERETVMGDRATAKVWILKEQQPVSITVRPIATDGALTAVTASDLHEGSPVIVHAVSKGEIIQ